MSKNGKAYERNKAAKVGETIKCACCGKEFVKKQYSQAFCCGKCKDRYWNRKGDRHHGDYYRNYNEEHPERLDFLRERYLRRNIPGLSRAAEEEREALREYWNNPEFRDYVNDAEHDGMWDAHECYVSLSVQLENFEGLGEDW